MTALRRTLCGLLLGFLFIVPSLKVHPNPSAPAVPFPPRITDFPVLPQNGDNTAEDISRIRATVPKQGIAGPEIYPIPIPKHPSIGRFLAKYLLPQHIDWITTAYKRGMIYRDFIVETIRNFKAPYELLFLPVVESEFINTTLSRSGALGIWQFMLNSIYPDMYVNRWMDDRKNFWKATEAAVHKLLFNYSCLGDWSLALAAYNCGLGCVQRAIEAAGTDDYWELSDRGYLPPETVNYVPRYYAIVKILSYPGRLGAVLPWREKTKWDAVPLSQTVDLRMVAEYSGVPYNILRAGNGELHYTITPPEYIPFHLKVPAVYTDHIKRTLEDNRFKLLRFYFYTINRGDTLYALALHYGVSVDMILRYNPNIRPEALQIGQTVVIPALTEVQPYVTPKQTETEKTAPDNRRYTKIYTVRKGDTLWSIASAHDTSVAMLTEENGISAQSVLQPGQQLKVPE